MLTALLLLLSLSVGNYRRYFLQHVLYSRRQVPRLLKYPKKSNLFSHHVCFLSSCLLCPKYGLIAPLGLHFKFFLKVIKGWISRNLCTVVNIIKNKSCHLFFGYVILGICIFIVVSINPLQFVAASNSLIIHKLHFFFPFTISTVYV